jgi:rhodanese-related sulfurtransferase
MVTAIDSDQLRNLMATGGQLVEVLPEEEYRWAHLPGARSIPLESLPERVRELDPNVPTIVYCADLACDLSPRAAVWLDNHGFSAVFDYAGGKTDWLAADAPYEGTARLVGRHVRRDVASVPVSATVRDAKDRTAEGLPGPVIVVDDHGIVQGAAYSEALEKADDDAPVETVAKFGISTVRPSEEVEALVERMEHAELTRIPVTKLDGALVGLFIADDARSGA